MIIPERYCNKGHGDLPSARRVLLAVWYYNSSSVD